MLHQKVFSNNLIDSLKITPDVSNLFKEIIETLDANGEELLADNILFRCNKLGTNQQKYNIGAKKFKC